MNTFNPTSLTGIASSLASCIGIAPPEKAEAPIAQLTDLAARACSGRPITRVLMYNPDAIAQWLFQKYKPDFAPVLAHTQLALPLRTMVPPKTPVCFATMYTGAEPPVHGIIKPERVVLKIDTLFDALARAGRRAAIVAMQKSSMSILFGERDIDYFILPSDEAVTEKALELIEADQYDFLAVYHSEYDDNIHGTYPESPSSLAAMRKHIASFAALAEATDKHWAAYDRLIGFATDHGVHTGADGVGTHGEEIPEDMNITHFYGVQPGKGSM